jgi:hypothetical protein
MIWEDHVCKALEGGCNGLLQDAITQLRSEVECYCYTNMLGDSMYQKWYEGRCGPDTEMTTSTNMLDFQFGAMTFALCKLNHLHHSYLGSTTFTWAWCLAGWLHHHGEFKKWRFSAQSLLHTEIHAGLHVKCLLLMSDFNHNCNVLTHCSETPLYKI